MAAVTSPQPLAVGEAIQNNIENHPQQNPKQTYASQIVKKNSAVNSIELCPVTFDHGEPRVEFTVEEVNQFTREEGLHQAVIVKFSYGKPELQEFRKIFAKQFDVKGYCNIGQLEFRHLLIRFPWTLGFNPREETSKSVVWISFPDLPPNFFAKKSLMSIASAVGKPLVVDKATQDRTRPSAARVKVLLDLLDKHPKKIKIHIIDKVSGKSVEFYQMVVYDNLPKYCTCCNHQGHAEQTCRWKIDDSKDGLVAATEDGASSSVDRDVEKTSNMEKTVTDEQLCNGANTSVDRAEFDPKDKAAGKKAISHVVQGVKNTKSGRWSVVNREVIGRGVNVSVEAAMVQHMGGIEAAGQLGLLSKQTPSITIAGTHAATEIAGHPQDIVEDSAEEAAENDGVNLSMATGKSPTTGHVQPIAAGNNAKLAEKATANMDKKHVKVAGHIVNRPLENKALQQKAPVISEKMDQIKVHAGHVMAESDMPVGHFDENTAIHVAIAIEGSSGNKSIAHLEKEKANKHAGQGLNEKKEKLAKATTISANTFNAKIAGHMGSTGQQSGVKGVQNNMHVGHRVIEQSVAFVENKTNENLVERVVKHGGHLDVGSTRDNGNTMAINDDVPMSKNQRLSCTNAEIKSHQAKTNEDIVKVAFEKIALNCSPTTVGQDDTQQIQGEQHEGKELERAKSFAGVELNTSQQDVPSNEAAAATVDRVTTEAASVGLNSAGLAHSSSNAATSSATASNKAMTKSNNWTEVNKSPSKKQSPGMNQIGPSNVIGVSNSFDVLVNEGEHIDDRVGPETAIFPIDVQATDASVQADRPTGDPNLLAEKVIKSKLWLQQHEEDDEEAKAWEAATNSLSWIQQREFDDQEDVGIDFVNDSSDDGNDGDICSGDEMPSLVSPIPEIGSIAKVGTGGKLNATAPVFIPSSRQLQKIEQHQSNALVTNTKGQSALMTQESVQDAPQSVNVGIDLYEEGEEDAILQECRLEASRKGDLSPMHSGKSKKSRTRDTSWDGRQHNQDLALRIPPMRNAKQKASVPTTSARSNKSKKK